MNPSDLRSIAEKRAQEEANSWHYEQSPPEEMQRHKILESFKAGTELFLPALVEAMEGLEDILNGDKADAHYVSSDVLAKISAMLDIPKT